MIWLCCCNETIKIIFNLKQYPPGSSFLFRAFLATKTNMICCYGLTTAILEEREKKRERDWQISFDLSINCSIPEIMIKACGTGMLK